MCIRDSIGTVATIYESRPNVTVDIAAICIKTNNVCILKGGKEAINSNIALVTVSYTHLDVYKRQPFARGSQGIFENEVLMKIAKQHNKTIGQVALRFLIQNGIIAIPKSTHKNRMEENFNIFDFSRCV